MKKASLKPLPVKCTVYQAISELNRLLEDAVERLGQLTAFNIFPGEYLRACQVMIEEVRALTNEQLTETINERELQNSAYYERLRLKWQRQFEEPTNAPDAERSSQQSQKPQSKKQRSSAKRGRAAREKGKAVRL